MADNTTAQAGFRTYIGLRYVPIIAGLWDITKDYEQLMIVTYQGNSYTSKKPVPAGIPLTNDEYWVMTGNYNVQVANLQAELEAAVRQILDYATDFEKFKTDMMALYDGFVVDADGKVLAKVEEYEHIIGEQYEAFVRYVNNAINDFRSEMDSFTSETREQINTYLSNTSQELDTKFTNYTNLVNTNISNFEGNIGGAISNLQDDVRNLSTSGQMSDTEVQREVSQARGGYDSLGQRLNAMNNIFLGYKDISVPSGVFDMNNYTTIGIYNTREGTSTTLYNTPFGDDIANEGFTLVVYADKLNNNFVKQLLTIVHNGTLYEYERFMIDGVFREWKTFVTPESAIICSENVTLVNFNAIPTNTLYAQNGFESESAPSNAPNIIAGDSYTVLTLGSLANRTQIVYTGTNNRCFIRRRIGTTWTDWDYLTTSDDLDSAIATLSAKIANANIIENSISDLAELNATNFGKNFNICHLSGGIISNESGYCYVYNYNDSNNGIHQIIEFMNTGKSYVRSKASDTWSDFKECYDLSSFKTYNEWDGSGISFTALKSQIVSSTKYFTEKIVKIKFNDSTPFHGDSRGYLITHEYGDTPNNVINLTFITNTGKIYYSKYTGYNTTWEDFSECSYANDYVLYSHSPSGISLSDFDNIGYGTGYDDKKIGIVHFSEDITGDSTPNTLDRWCYVYSNSNLVQIFVTFTGRTFTRTWDSIRSIWNTITECSYANNYVVYGDFSNGISVSDFNNLTLDNKKIGIVKFSEDITGDANPDTLDRICYVQAYSANYQIFTTYTGRVFTRHYMTPQNVWSAFSSPYYTKAEIDAMLQNI